jgi:hypothetical protein
VATLNLRAFGGLTEKWRPEPGDSPRRDLFDLRCIAEVVSRFDIVAIEEARENLSALRLVLEALGDLAVSRNRRSRDRTSDLPPVKPARALAASRRQFPISTTMGRFSITAKVTFNPLRHRCLPLSSSPTRPIDPAFGSSVGFIARSKLKPSNPQPLRSRLPLDHCGLERP